jgi:hypothetical protein
MNELKAAIQGALQSDDPIQREQVRAWIHAARDVETLAFLYRLTDKGWNRIEPRLDKDETCLLMARYLLICVRENPQGGVALPRYEAAGELEAWFDHLSNMDDTQEILQAVAALITNLYLTSDNDVRGAIETGFLEHVLEQARLRPLFTHWADNERLRDAWQHALAWGEAHLNYTRGMREQLRALRNSGNPANPR